jgi:hypothetical protein
MTYDSLIADKDWISISDKPMPTQIDYRFLIQVVTDFQLKKEYFIKHNSPVPRELSSDAAKKEKIEIMDACYLKPIFEGGQVCFWSTFAVNTAFQKIIHWREIK